MKGGHTNLAPRCWRSRARCSSAWASAASCNSSTPGPGRSDADEAVRPGALRGGAVRSVRPDPAAARAAGRTQTRSALGGDAPGAGLGWTPGRLLHLDTVLLTHKQIARRDLVPGAVLTAVGLVVLMLVSRYVMQFWVDLYARDYGGLGVIMAVYFWLALSSAAIVWAASIAPALAERREFRRLLAPGAGARDRS